MVYQYVRRAIHPKYRKYADSAVAVGSAMYGHFANSTPKRRASGSMGIPVSKKRAVRSGTRFTPSSIPEEVRQRRVLRVARRSHGAKQSKSAGFVKRGRRLLKRRIRFQNNGITINKEIGKVYSATEAIYLGHFTCPGYQIRLMAWMALIKNLYKRAYGKSPETTALSFNSSGSIAVLWRKFEDDTQNNVELNPLGVNNTIEKIAIWLSDPDRDWNKPANLVAGADYWNTMILDDLILYPPSTFTGVNHYSLTRVRLEGQMVHFSSKSTFKIQNRSTNAATWIAGTEANEVDSVPLFGKSYEGTGSGAYHVSKTNAASFIADGEYGMIEAAAAINSLTEPPNGNEFVGVKRTGKIRMDPGDIKTSSLTASFSINFNKLHVALMNQYSSTIVGQTIPQLKKKRLDFGKFRFFGLEKMLDARADPAIAFPMTFAIEHNLRMYCEVRGKESKTTCQLTTKNHLPSASFA